MAKRKLSDAELAALPPQTRKETLRKRQTRERQKLKESAGNVVPVDFSLPAAPAGSAPQLGEVIRGLDPDDQGARELYLELRAKLQAVGRWSGGATHTPLLTYVKTTMAIERYPAVALPPSVFAANKGARADLRLGDLPGDKVRKGAGRFDF